MTVSLSIYRLICQRIAEHKACRTFMPTFSLFLNQLLKCPDILNELFSYVRRNGPLCRYIERAVILRLLYSFILFFLLLLFFLRGWVGRLYIANVTDVNSTDTDPIRAVWSGSALFAKVTFEDARVWSEFLFESIRSHFDQLKLILVHGSCNEEPDLSFLKRWWFLQLEVSLYLSSNVFPFCFLWKTFTMITIHRSRKHANIIFTLLNPTFI